MSITILLSPVEAEAAGLRRLIRDNGSEMATNGTEPHLSLIVFDAVDLSTATDAAKAIGGNFASISLNFVSVGIFPGQPAVVFLQPVVTQALLDLHQRLHAALGPLSAAGRPHYLPDSWLPHLTIASPVSRSAAPGIARRAAESNACRTYSFDRIEIVVTPPWSIHSSHRLSAPR